MSGKQSMESRGNATSIAVYSSHKYSSPSLSKTPKKITTPEHKAWLTSKGAPTGGKKSDLVDRYGICD